MPEPSYFPLPVAALSPCRAGDFSRSASLPSGISSYHSTSNQRQTWKGYLPCRRSFTVLGLRWLFLVLSFLSSCCWNWKIVHQQKSRGLLLFLCLFKEALMDMSWLQGQHKIGAGAACHNTNTPSPMHAMTKVTKTFRAIKTREGREKAPLFPGAKMLHHNRFYEWFGAVIENGFMTENS